MTAAEIIKALGGHGGKARCPAHDDKNPSLSISDKPTGGVLVRCHAGCSQEAVIDALKSRGQWPNVQADDAGLRPTTHPQFGRPTEVYHYTETFEVWRFDLDDGGKEIRPLSRTDGQWKWKTTPAPRPLYRLSELAAHPNKPVLLVEGEKTTETARFLIDDHVIATWPGGAHMTKYIDWTPLKGRDVTLWPDADEDGRAAMFAAASRRAA